jgi:mRNA-degrading endonuclease RelE of RelBE toxin-antitoxin system
MPGLERRFAEDIKKAIRVLENNPFAHAIRHKNIRVAHPVIFPYCIHYYIDDAQMRIVIVGIVHNSRNPEHLRARVK